MEHVILLNLISYTHAMQQPEYISEMVFCIVVSLTAIVNFREFASL